MKFHIGAIPLTPDFSPSASWRAMREPTPWVVQLLAFPIGITSGGTVLLLWFVITPLEGGIASLSIPALLLSFAFIIVVHELIHAVVHPMQGRSPHSLLGFWPSRVVFYAHYDGELTRNRFVAILLMPLLVISLVPLFVASVAQVTSAWAAYVSSINALLACADILGAGLVLYQIPADTTVRNQGWRTFWREQKSVEAEPSSPTGD